MPKCRSGKHEVASYQVDNCPTCEAMRRADLQKFMQTPRELVKP